MDFISGASRLNRLYENIVELDITAQSVILEDQRADVQLLQVVKKGGKCSQRTSEKVVSV